MPGEFAFEKKTFAEYVTHATAAATGRLAHLLFTGYVETQAGQIKLIRETFNPLTMAQAQLPNGAADIGPPGDEIYNQMQGPNEFTITGNLRGWDRWADLPEVAVPTLVTGARYDEMNPASIRREARLIPNARLFMSETGSHLAMWDDQAAYFAAILSFLATLDPGPSTT